MNTSKIGEDVIGKKHQTIKALRIRTNQLIPNP